MYILEYYKNIVQNIHNYKNIKTYNIMKTIDNTPNLSHNKNLVGDILKCVQFKVSPYS